MALGAFAFIKAVNYARADVVAADTISLDEEGDGDNATQRMLEATDLAPDFPEYLLEISRMFGETVGSYGSLDARQRLTPGQYIHALRVREARELAPPAMASAAVGLHLIGQEGRLDEEVRLSQEALATMPNGAISHYAVALTYLVAGEV